MSLHLMKKKSFGPVQAVELGYSPIGPPIMSVYFYYLNGLLIDTGQHHMQRHALDAIGDLPVRQILLTHHHEDHSGNAAAFQKKTGAPVRGHILTASKLRKGYRIRLYQHLIWGRTAPVGMAVLDTPIQADPYVLEPVETPGHSKDHVVFLEKNFGWLFSGDLYIGERIKFFRSDEDLEAQIHSLQKVMRLDFDTLFCAHNPCPKNGKRHLSRKLDYLVTLKQKVIALHQKGYSVKEIIRRLDPGTDRRVKWITMGNASFAHMVRSALKSV
jgi:glyoxylase-like metal-dependent hydrolase (beta-lactamase superfamily II)